VSPRIRGLIYFVGFLAFAAIFCGLVPFLLMPSIGAGVALPVIEVPGEVVQEDLLPGFNLTNSIIGTLVTDFLLILIVFVLWRLSRGWTKEVPGRLQGMFEAFVSGFRSFSSNIGGERLRTTPMLWPLVATIFLFLLTANYMKLFPGAETVGKMHCAYEGQSGYSMIPGWTDSSYRLWVDESLNAGSSQTAETYDLCNYYFKYGEFSRFPVESVEEIEPQVEAAQQAVTDAERELADRTAALAGVLESLDADESNWSDADRDSVNEAEAAVLEGTDDLARAERALERQQIRLEAAQQIPALEAELEEVTSQINLLDDSAVRSELDRQEDLVDEPRYAAAGFTLAAAEGVADAVALAQERGATSGDDLSEVLSDLRSERSELEEELNFQRTQMQFPTATLTFTESQLETDAVPFIFHITPFVRGPATDLSLTIALAIFSIVVVQIYGVMALGPAYFEKFVNLTAIGNVGKRPLGVIDFIVGLIEIISEIGKIVSLAFRLFGNLFAGGVALMAVTFLLAMLVPGVIYGLELIIGAVQALVFAVLTLVFSVQAMEAHHEHPDHEEHDEEHHDGDEQATSRLHSDASLT